jgi:uncharacterized protein YabN with tetrapyrrole methylase and pyrophosphatase domain
MDLLKKVKELEQDADSFGFRWEKPEQIMQQIQSECLEIEEHLHTTQDPKALQEEIGDLMHAVFSLCVFCNFDPQDTLAGTLKKFERRLTAVKQLAQAEGKSSLKDHDFAELMQYWDQAKRLVG